MDAQEYLLSIRPSPNELRAFVDPRADHTNRWTFDANAYLHRYCNGHHSPVGNFFTSCEIKDALAEWLDPTPLPY